MNTETALTVIDRIAPDSGLRDTPLAGVQVFRVTDPIDRAPGVYPPSVCAILQGTKRAYYDGAVHTYDAHHFLCNAMPLPVEAEVPGASPEWPVLGLLVSLDTTAMGETLVAYETSQVEVVSNTESTGPGLVVAPWDPGFRDALFRLVEVLDDPVALHVLGSARLREFLFSVLRGPAGAILRRRLGKGSRMGWIVRHVRDNLAEPLAVDDLARRAGMSRAVFHRRFKEATSQSPIQFIKALRLNSAAMLITQGLSVGGAATHVGYSSPSQFSREFRRHFGRAPREWRELNAELDVQASVP
ncbi:MAG: AraC family transcriptional regulator [Acidimicrobiia bacterium]|nr:AraC family transcriptional regulator [Acidimicrobiia bacterium]